MNEPSYNNNTATMARDEDFYMDIEAHIDPDVQRNVSSLITAVSFTFLAPI